LIAEKISVEEHEKNSEMALVWQHRSVCQPYKNLSNLKLKIVALKRKVYLLVGADFADSRRMGETQAVRSAYVVADAIQREALLGFDLPDMESLVLATAADRIEARSKVYVDP
jgi:hypothetical protein